MWPRTIGATTRPVSACTRCRGGGGRRWAIGRQKKIDRENRFEYALYFFTPIVTQSENCRRRRSEIVAPIKKPVNSYYRVHSVFRSGFHNYTQRMPCTYRYGLKTANYPPDRRRSTGHLNGLSSIRRHGLRNALRAFAFPVGEGAKYVR